MVEVVRVFTNDPVRPELRLSITGQVKSFASVEPRYLQLVGQVGASLSGTAVVSPVEEFVVTGIRAEPEHIIEARFEELIRDGQTSYLVTVKSLQVQPGRHYVMVHLTTDRPSRPEISIPVLIIIR